MWIPERTIDAAASYGSIHGCIHIAMETWGATRHGRRGSRRCGDWRPGPEDRREAFSAVMHHRREKKERFWEVYGGRPCKQRDGPK